MTHNTAPISSQEKISARVDFDARDFDIQIDQHGIELCHEKSVPCSCIREINGSALNVCASCGGSGWVFIDLAEIRGIVQAITFDPRYMEYSKINLGTAMLTVKHTDTARLSWWDRITIVDGESVFHESIFPELRDSNAEASTLLTYDAKEVDTVFMFINATTPQLKLVEDTDFTIDKRKFVFSTTIRDAMIAGNETKRFVSIRYTHNPQYAVMDVQKDIRNTNVLTKGNKESLEHMPIHCIMKKLHYMLGDKGFDE